MRADGLRADGPVRAFQCCGCPCESWGRQFVRFYYARGPAWASVVEGRPGLRWLVRALLLPVVAGAYVLLQPATLRAAAFVLVFTVMLGVLARRPYRWRRS
ncbi:MAG: hypothetical protein ACE5H5_00945 [Nitrospinota bacterium]